MLLRVSVVLLRVSVAFVKGEYSVKGECSGVNASVVLLRVSVALLRVSAAIVKEMIWEWDIKRYISDWWPRLSSTFK